MTSATGLFDSAPIQSAAEQVLSELAPDRTIVVTGHAGAGRGLLFDAVSGELASRAVPVRVPSHIDADAPIHALLLGASCLGSEMVEVAADRTNGTLIERFTHLMRAIARADGVLLLRTAEELGYPQWDEDPNGDWLGELVRAARETTVTLVLVLPWPVAKRLGRAAAATTEISLPPCVAHLDALMCAERWGSYAEVAATLRRTLGKTTLPLSPLQLRLMVGLVGLGVPHSVVAEAGRRLGAGDLVPLARMLVSVLERDQLVAVRESVRRLALLRTALPIDSALSLAAPPTEHQALLHHCIGYGEDTLRMPDVLRSLVLQRLPRTLNEDEGHRVAADYHAALDGALSPRDAARAGTGRQEPVSHWLEKVHHLAHAGPLGDEDWGKQQFSSREFLIARARALSIHHRRYLEAARLYERCLAWWPRDAYALHYRAYNLDAAGHDAKEVDRCYRAALTEQPTNLFFNSRWVTFLIEQGRLLDADRAWQEAHENLATRDPEHVAYHVPLHVVGKWLDAGEVARARRVFDLLPLDAQPGSLWLRTEHRLLDAEEALALGVSVYWSTVPMAQRWRRPQIAPPQRRKAALASWFPGQVISADAERVLVAIATPADDPGARRVIMRPLTAAEWEGVADWASAEEAAGYLEVAEYGEERELVIYQVPEPSLEERPSALAPQSDAHSEPHPLRYLMRELPGSPIG